MSAFVRAHRRGAIGAVAVFLLVSPFLLSSDDITGVLVIALLMSALAWWLIARRSVKGEVRWRGKLPRKVRHDLRKAATVIDRDTVILDLETTGKNPYTDEPVEIGAVRLQPGGKVSYFWKIVNPGPIDIDPCAEAAHGLSRYVVRRVGVPVREAWKAFERFAQGTEVLVAYNATFDFTFMDRALARYGTPSIIAETRCALKKVKQTMRLKSYHLKNVAQACLGEITVTPHTALGDAALTAMVWAYLQSNESTTLQTRIARTYWRGLKTNGLAPNDRIEHWR